MMRAIVILILSLAVRCFGVDVVIGTTADSITWSGGLNSVATFGTNAAPPSPPSGPSYWTNPLYSSMAFWFNGSYGAITNASGQVVDSSSNANYGTLGGAAAVTVKLVDNGTNAWGRTNWVYDAGLATGAYFRLSSSFGQGCTSIVWGAYVYRTNITTSANGNPIIVQTNLTGQAYGIKGYTGTNLITRSRGGDSISPAFSLPVGQWIPVLAHTYYRGPSITAWTTEVWIASTFYPGIVGNNATNVIDSALSTWILGNPASSVRWGGLAAGVFCATNRLLDQDVVNAFVSNAIPTIANMEWRP